MSRPPSCCEKVWYRALNVLLIAAIPVFMFFLNGWATTDINDQLRQCALEGDSGKRLECFDKLAGTVTQTGADRFPAQPNDRKSRDGEIARAAGRSSDTKKEPSVISRQWELDDASREAAPIIRAHRPNYFLAAAYNSSPNRDMILDVDRDAIAQYNEAKFQLSFKVKLWEDMLKDVDLWFGYTQLSFWQIYNSTFSSPFRETNYEPEGLFNIRTDYDLLGLGFLKGRFVNIGFNHQSNGRAKPLSRSWNRVVANFGFEGVRQNNFNLLLKTWYRVPENARDDDNPDIDKYMGYGELWGYYYGEKHRLAVMLRSNLRPKDQRGAVQLDWSFLPSWIFPFIRNDRVSVYLQYFNGYGESLLDYNANVNRIGIGIMLADWIPSVKKEK